MMATINIQMLKDNYQDVSNEELFDEAIITLENYFNVLDTNELYHHSRVNVIAYLALLHTKTLNNIKQMESKTMTNEDIKDLFDKQYPQLKSVDYRPISNVFVEDKQGITIWLENGDIIFYFPNEGR